MQASKEREYDLLWGLFFLLNKCNRQVYCLCVLLFSPMPQNNCNKKIHLARHLPLTISVLKH